MRIQTGGVSGGEVLGAQDRGLLGYRHTGFGQAGQLGDDPVADVLEVGDPFGHQPAHFREHLDELRGRGDGGAYRRHTGVDRLLRGTEPGPVLGQLSGGAEDLGGRALSGCRSLAKPVGDCGGGLAEPGRLARALRFGQFTAGIELFHRRQPVGADDGGEPDTRHDRDALKHGGGCSRGCTSHDVDYNKTLTNPQERR